jgi:hypothetical protein
MFSCEIDMDAWRNLHIAGNNLPSEIDLCNRYCSEHILAGFAHAQVGRMAPGGEVWLRRDDLLHFVFDRNEEYFGPFRDKRDAELKKVEDIGKSSMWQLVGDVTEGVMKESPGIQAADMFAWALNRENTMPYGSKGTGVADAMRAAVGSCMKVYDEESLRREYGSDFP